MSTDYDLWKIGWKDACLVWKEVMDHMENMDEPMARTRLAL